MISIDIPGSVHFEIEHFVTDFSGTLSECKELEGVACTLHILRGEDHTGQKERYIVGLGANHVAALGNGNNDVRMLKAAGVGIAVCLREGCSVESFQAAKIFVCSPTDGIELLLYPKRLIAILRR